MKVTERLKNMIDVEYDLISIDGSPKTQLLHDLEAVQKVTLSLTAKADLFDELVVALEVSVNYVKAMMELQHKSVDTMITIAPKGFVPPKWTKPDMGDIKALLKRAKEMKDV